MAASRLWSNASRRYVLEFAVGENAMLTLTVIVVVLLLATVAVLAYSASKPDTFRVQRDIDIAAPPEKIFPLINDLHAHTGWSPFKKDPAMKRTHSGAEEGKGAIYEWE